MQCHDNFPRINVPDFKLLSNGPISDLRMLRNQGKVFQRAVLESFSYVLIEGHNLNENSKTLQSSPKPPIPQKSLFSTI